MTRSKITPADIAPGGRPDAFGVLAARFGVRTGALVAAVTNPEYEPGQDEHRQCRDHVTANLQGDQRARVIKALDFTDNAIGLIHLTEAV